MLLVLLFLFFSSLTAIEKRVHPKEYSEEIILSAKEINIPSYPCAYNPSICKTKEGVLLLFRYRVPGEQTYISHIGIVKLDSSFKIKGKPQLLNTRGQPSKTPSQSEDARLFTINGEPYLIFNDNRDVVNPNLKQRRDMYLCKLLYDGKSYVLSPPIKLVYPERVEKQNWEKNWVPFEWEKGLFLSYTICPHEVLFPNQQTGLCTSVGNSNFVLSWDWGIIRGGTPALKVGEEYLAFFHSRERTSSPTTFGISMPHYYIGAYTFAPYPPFALTKISPSPILSKKFYTRSKHHSRIVFPGGFVVTKDIIYLAYGKDDKEIWLAKMDRKKLLRSLRKID